MNVKGVAAGLAAASLLFTVPAQAGGMSQAEKLRRLDIMLMVTGLRCRTGPSNFQADYGRFTTNHIAELNAASRAMKADLAKRYGAAGANRALDKLSVTMANDYGNGHPWLGCDQLKKVASNLAAAKGSGPLVEAADQLLGDSAGGSGYNWARR
ncbi:MAG: S-adenosyl-L-homocysteine hydrolase [Novosphingobium sp.]